MILTITFINSNGKKAKDYRRNLIKEREYWDYVINKLNLRYKTNDLKKLWFDQYRPIEGMASLLSELRKQYTLAYLSNNIPERVKYLQKNINF